MHSILSDVTYSIIQSEYVLFASLFKLNKKYTSVVKFELGEIQDRCIREILAK